MTHEGVEKYRAFVDEAADLVVRYGGSLSGEHGDGQSRAELLPKMFGRELVQAFREFKAIWDPDEQDEPGQGRRPEPDHEQSAARAPTTDRSEPKTHFSFPDDHGSFAHATVRCVGVGKCRTARRRRTMCPSYMVTREEKHSTRGRARLLFEMLQGDELDRRLEVTSRSARRSTSAWPARAARATARSTSTWRPTRPSSSRTITTAACARVTPMRWA